MKQVNLDNQKHFQNLLLISFVRICCFLVVGVFLLANLFFINSALAQSQSQKGYVEEYQIISDSISNNDSVVFILEPQDVDVSTQFYDSLRNRAARNKLLQAIHDFLVVQTEDAKVFKTDKIDEVENPFFIYRGKEIRSVKIKQLNVFGTTLKDTIPLEISWYEEFGNWMHISTHENIIRENLLFQEGDEVDPLLLADNERVLRRLPYLKEAKILVEGNEIDSQAVDLVVITQDVWSKGFNVDMKNINAGQVEMFDNNIFGIGHRFKGDLIFDYFKLDNPGFQTSYKIDNLAGSFINSRFVYLNAFADQYFGLNFSRGFFSYKTNWVGGIEASKTTTRKNIRKKDTILFNTPLEYVEHDYWLGYSIPVESNRSFFRKRNRLVFSARYNRSKFFEGPEVNERYNYQYHNHHTFLASISFSRQNFYQSSLIYGFGRTEDIPVGDLLAYTFGWEKDEFFKRFYSGISIKHGEYFSNFGYLSNQLNFGGFIYEDDFEQGVLDFRTKYISRLFRINNLKIRQFIDLNYTYGIDRFPDEMITFNPGTDVRGLSDEALFGDKKLVLKLETVGFSNLYYYGFRFAFYGFADIGFIGPEKRIIFDNPVQSGFGLGLRIRNESLVFNTLQIRLGYYPNLNNGSNLLFRISGEKTLVPYRYTPSAPSIVDF